MPNDWSTMTGRRPHEGPISDELANDWCFMPALGARPYPRSHRLVDLDLWSAGPGPADWCFIAARAREGHAFASDWPFMLKHQCPNPPHPMPCQRGAFSAPGCGLQLLGALGPKLLAPFFPLLLPRLLVLSFLPSTSLPTFRRPDLSLRRAGLARGLCSHLFSLSSRLSGAGTPLDAGLQLLLPSFSPPPALYTLVCTRLQRGETNASFFDCPSFQRRYATAGGLALGAFQPPFAALSPRPRSHGPRAAGGGCPPCCHPRRGKWWSVCVCVVVVVA